LYPFVTVYSRERNADGNGVQRINVTNGQGQALSDLLAQNLSQARAGQVLAAARRGQPFSSVLDFYVRTGLSYTEFAAIADRITTSTQTTLRGLVNVNTAPKEVLACLPGLEDTDAIALANMRMQTGVDLSNIAWVTQALAPSKVAAIGNTVTVRSYRFSADIVSVARDGRAFRRCRIMVNAQNSPPKVMYRQDLTHLGWPLAPEVLSALRAGASVEEADPFQGVIEGGTR
jgi:type II secretory pathway component PulK